VSEKIYLESRDRYGQWFRSTLPEYNAGPTDETNRYTPPSETPDELAQALAEAFWKEQK